MHLKRSNAGNFWPIPRKGTKYLAMPMHNQRDSITLVLLIRDMLKLAKNSKEVKRAVNEKKIKINQKIVKEINYPICLFDIISLEDGKKNYRVTLSKYKKIILDEISEKEAETKIFKVLGKKILGNKVIQLNLMHGINIISKEKVDIGNSVVYNFKEKKITKVLPLEKGKEVFIMKGAHVGRTGKIDDIVTRGGKLIAKINSDKGKINVWIKNLIIVG